MAAERDRSLLLFDGACRSCRAFARAVRALDRDDVVQFAPLQDEVARARYEALLGPAYWSSFHLVQAGAGSIRSGADALGPLAELLPAVRPFAPLLFGTPGLRRLPRAAYAAASFARTCRVASARA